MKRISKLFCGIVFTLFVLTLPVLAFAQQSGMQISPVTYNFDLKPGESKDATITITNLNDAELNYVMEADNFSVVSDDGAPSFGAASVDQTGKTTLKDWVTFNSADKEGVIPAKKDKLINFSINVPTGAEPGGHYAAVFAKEVKKNAEGKTEISVTSRVGTLILVSIPGTVTKGAEISESSSPKFVWKGPVDFTMKVKNTGSVHYDSSGEVKIKPLFGTTATIDLGKHTIIPDNSRNFTGEWGKKYPFGYYEVTFSATDGDGQPVTVTTTLWALPLIIVIPVLLGLIIIILIIRYVRRNFKVVKQ